jgi:hypothetical protein
LEGQRSHKAEGTIWRNSVWGSFTRGSLQEIENEDERLDIEKKEGSGGSKSQTFIERGDSNSENRKDS